MITAERLRSLLSYNPETGIFTWRVRRGRILAGTVTGGIGSHGYVEIRVDYRLYLAHRLAWLYMTGEWPKETIDHRDLDRTNNRWRNLREATFGQNNTNRRARGAQGLKGVTKNRRAYVAQIQVAGRNRYLGSFATPEAAHAAYVAASSAHGEFARAA
jgi:hypothetical protein